VANPAVIGFARAQLDESDVTGRSVLEVGSLDADGSCRSWVEKLGPASYVGVDLVRGPGVDELCAAERVAERFGQESVDLVLATELVEHVHDWRAAVAAMKAVLRPGGALLLTTRSPGFPYHGAPLDYWRFEPNQLQAIFADFDLEALELDPMMPGVFVKARKRGGGERVDLDGITPLRVSKPGRRSRAFSTLWRVATRTLARLPLRFRSLRQLSREALAGGAIQKIEELEALAGLVRDLRPRTVLEIGSYRGGTLRAWCNLAAPSALLVSVDLPAEYVGASTQELQSLARPGQRVVVIRSDSQSDSTRAAVETVLAGDRLDFLMIDGDHTYEGVSRDFELYSPLVREGGLIAFHDILPHSRMPGVEVHRLWQELRSRYDHEEFVDPARVPGLGQWGGIGVLRYRAPR
jgi:predicted O-methyltransferase YrrM